MKFFILISKIHNKEKLKKYLYFLIIHIYYILGKMKIKGFFHNYILNIIKDFLEFIILNNKKNKTKNITRKYISKYCKKFYRNQKDRVINFVILKKLILFFK